MTEKSYSQVQKEYREYKRDAPTAPRGSVRISLQSNFTIDPLAAYIWKEARNQGIDTDIHVGRFGQYAQEFLNEASPLYEFNPELVFLFLRPQDDLQVAQTADSIRPLIQSLRNRSKARLILSNFIVPVAPFYLRSEPVVKDFERANELIAGLAAGAPNVLLLDLDELAAYFGKKDVVNWKLHYLGNIDFSPEFQALVARKCAAYIRLARQSAKKVLVLDLDDTLWGGVVGEAGDRGISLGPNGPGAEFVAFQKAILKLNRRGILLAVNSKNNPDDAIPVIENHPDMILRPEHFSSMRINWNDKASNIREIAGELNLGLDSFVFLDNSPVERGWVRSRLPEVMVPDLPQDPALYAPFLEQMDVFEVLEQTREDLDRARMYAQESQRKQVMDSSASLEDYLKSLQIKLIIAPLNQTTLPRACQMIMKTNQFNLTTRRHAQGDLAAFLDSPEYEIYTLSVSDIYGGSGVTGLAVLKFEGRDCRIDSLLLSCRILGRRIEETFLYILAKAAGKRATRLIGEFIPTKKNSQVRDFYPSNGFAPLGPGNDGELFAFDLKTGGIKPCELHQVNLEGFEL